MSTCRLAIAGKQPVVLVGMRSGGGENCCPCIKITTVYELFCVLHVAPNWNLTVINQELYKHVTLKKSSPLKRFK